MIPKIIHQIWIGPLTPPLDFMETWRAKHTGWQYWFWDEARIADEFPSGLSNQIQFDAMPELCGKCDILRYEILFRFGGVYIDADSKCLASLDEYLLENDSFAVYENEFCRPGLIANGYIGATRENKLMAEMISEISFLAGKRLWNGMPSAWHTVGPRLFTDVVNKLNYSCLSVYPSFYFIPNHYTGFEYSGPAKVYADQFWGSTVGSSFSYNSPMFTKLIQSKD